MKGNWTADVYVMSDGRTELSPVVRVPVGVPPEHVFTRHEALGLKFLAWRVEKGLHADDRAAYENSSPREALSATHDVVTHDVT